MILTNEGIDLIEKYADKAHNAEVILICHIVREIREIKELLKEAQNSCNSGDYGAGGANDCKNKHG